MSHFYFCFAVLEGYGTDKNVVVSISTFCCQCSPHKPKSPLVSPWSHASQPKPPRYQSTNQGRQEATIPTLACLKLPRFADLARSEKSLASVGQEPGADQVNLHPTTTFSFFPFPFPFPCTFLLPFHLSLPLFSISTNSFFVHFNQI